MGDLVFSSGLPECLAFHFPVHLNSLLLSIPGDGSIFQYVQYTFDSIPRHSRGCILSSRCTSSVSFFILSSLSFQNLMSVFTFPL